jgi:endonuclease YncB( thermonuclease family)
MQATPGDESGAVMSSTPKSYIFSACLLLCAILWLLVLPSACAWQGDSGAADGTPTACAVATVLDGDTMDLVCKGRKLRIRLHCIDAPELDQEPWGRRSRDHLRSITPRVVILVPKSTKYGFKDRFGRTVGEILTPDETGQNLNISQVFTGNAAVYPRYCHDDRYYLTEEVARSATSGIWARRGLQQTPWRTRH